MPLDRAAAEGIAFSHLTLLVSHGHFLQTPSSGAHEYILVQNISFFGIYQVQNLVYY